jgi:hypothetical protein
MPAGEPAAAGEGPTLDARIASLLRGRWAPAGAGVASALAIWYVWASLRGIPIFHDEAAYLLQARIFAGLKWVAPGWPLPEFFEQFHVLVTPVLAAKYPPGHSLLLLPGVWLGLPALMPVLLVGIAGALVFVLARQAEGPWVGLLTWALWMSAPAVLRFLPSYFSETTSTVLWLLALWALGRYRTRSSSWYATLLGVAVAWLAITRPLTALALALPIGIVFLRTTVMRRRWRDLTGAFLAGVLVLGVMPLWSVETVGSWKSTPYGVYTRAYLPFDVMGWGLKSTPPLRALPADMQKLSRAYESLHAAHTRETLPSTALRRLRAIAVGMWGGSRGWLIPFAAVGVLVGLTGEVRLALWSWAALVVAYLTYAHPDNWTLYYVETMPGLAFVTARGVWLACSRALSIGASVLRPGTPTVVLPNERTAVVGTAVVTLVVMGWSFPHEANFARWRRTVLSDYIGDFRAALLPLSKTPAIVFVRYGPKHNPDFSLVTNEPDLVGSSVWVAHDLGSENGRLAALAPERRTYLYDEASRRLVPLTLGDSGR